MASQRPPVQSDAPGNTASLSLSSLHPHLTWEMMAYWYAAPILHLEEPCFRRPLVELSKRPLCHAMTLFPKPVWWKKKKKHPTANGLNHTTWPAKGTLISFQDTPAKVLLIPLNLTRYQNWWFGSLTLVLTVRFDVSMRRFKQISGVSVLRIIFLSGYA